MKRIETVNVIVDDNCFYPTHAHQNDAGYDLKTPVNIYLGPYSKEIVNTGVHIEVPKGWFVKVDEKSSLASRGVAILGGIIDSGYTGPIRVIMFNLSEEDILIRKEEKIAQFMFIPISTPELKTVEKFKDTTRGDNGFGSTGK